MEMFSMIKKLLREIYSDWLNANDLKKRAEQLVTGNDRCLDRYGFVQETDKASLLVDGDTIKPAHDYLRHYDFFFHAFRNNKLNLIEFGCYRGSSLKMWREYFPYGNIYGVDLDEDARQYETDRIHIVVGDATSPNTLGDIRGRMPEGECPFIIIDDASHAWADQRRSLELFWPFLEQGGFYVIEDLECGTLGAYPDFPPAVQDAQSFSDYMHDRSRILRWPADVLPRCDMSYLDHLPAAARQLEVEMDFCIFIPGAIIIRKKKK